MDYEKLHKDTITKLQEMVNSGKITIETARGICVDFVQESEDERIRKELLEHCRKQAEMYNTLLTAKEYSEVQSWIAWLEKQGEHAKFKEYK